MKMKTIFCFIFIAVIILISSCNPSPPVITSVQTPELTETPPATATADTAPGNPGVINVYSYSSEIMSVLDKFLELHPDFRYKINYFGINVDAVYSDYLDAALNAGGSDNPDIYCAESAFVTRYTKEGMSGYAMPYKDLGIDVEFEIAKADISQYIVDIGTRTKDKSVVGLAYQSSAGAFIYRRSIAKNVWGTDDPSVIAAKVGPGWDIFFKAASELKKKGYCIVSGDGDIWHSVENSADQGWIKNGKLFIDPKREAFLELSKKLSSNKYSNTTSDWTDAWYSDMAGTGKKPVFGFFGPSWLINYVIISNCGVKFDDIGNRLETGGTYGDWAVCAPTFNFFWGGSWIIANKSLSNDPDKKAAVADIIDWITLQCDNDSLQYLWANGMLAQNGVKDTVASNAVMLRSVGKLNFLGGQNMFDIFVPAAKNINTENITRYDDTINFIWRDQVRKYVNGKCTRDEAIEAFKQQVKDQFNIGAW